MREFGLAAEEHEPAHARFSTGFDEIDALASDCRFRDCRHADEPGCAVLLAVERGAIDRERLHHAHKLERELAWQRERQSVLGRREDKRRSRRRRPNED
jgi:ribosome biogenesis GTPase